MQKGPHLQIEGGALVGPSPRKGGDVSQATSSIGSPPQQRGCGMILAVLASAL
jgi:hypothetical protein